MNAVATQTQQVSEAESAFALAQRKAKAYASSTLVPEAYRGAENVGNVLIAMEIANRIGANELMTMQSLYIVHGRPSWSSSFLIATVNACGRFTPMRFETSGEDPKADSYRVRAYADDKATGERCNGPWITWEMVKAEGWYSKNGSKWKTMPELMFMYRSAGFWTRVYAPEVSMGIHTAEENDDISTGRTVATMTVTQASREPGTLAQIERELTGASEDQRVPVGEDLTAQQVHDRLSNASTRDELDEAASLITLLDKADQSDLFALYDKRALDIVGAE